MNIDDSVWNHLHVHVIRLVKILCSAYYLLVQIAHYVMIILQNCYINIPHVHHMYVVLIISHSILYFQYIFICRINHTKGQETQMGLLNSIVIPIMECGSLWMQLLENQIITIL